MINNFNKIIIPIAFFLISCSNHEINTNNGEINGNNAGNENLGNHHNTNNYSIKINNKFIRIDIGKK